MVSELTAHRRAFWTCFAERQPQLFERTERGNETTRWLAVGPLPLVAAHYIAARGVGVFVRGARATKIGHVRDFLFPLRQALAAALGPEAPRLGTTFLLETRLRIDMGDRANWPHAIDWLGEKSRLYEAALTAVRDRAPGNEPNPWDEDFPLLP